MTNDSKEFLERQKIEVEIEGIKLENEFKAIKNRHEARRLFGLSSQGWYQVSAVVAILGMYISLVLVPSFNYNKVKLQNDIEVQKRSLLAIKDSMDFLEDSLANELELLETGLLSLGVKADSLDSISTYLSQYSASLELTVESKIYSLNELNKNQTQLRAENRRQQDLIIKMEHDLDGFRGLVSGQIVVGKLVLDSLLAGFQKELGRRIVCIDYSSSFDEVALCDLEGLFYSKDAYLRFKSAINHDRSESGFNGNVSVSSIFPSPVLNACITTPQGLKTYSDYAFEFRRSDGEKLDKVLVVRMEVEHTNLQQIIVGLEVFKNG
ncbi:MAG TPA: hypothetical protein DCE41_14845 [Cytophagales bacterium]|nr:hypothetical protein [Cytophagales bacterium]